MANLEPKIQEVGLELFKLMKGQKPGLFNKAWWSGQMLEWATRDPEFKTEMFRFVDVFPVLTTPAAIAEHIREYLLKPGLKVPAVIKVALKGAGLGKLAQRVAAKQIAKNLEGMAHNFILGETPHKAMRKLKSLRSQRLGFTVDLLGEAVVSEPEADIFAARYLELIDTLADEAKDWPDDPLLEHDDAGPIPRVNVSIKVSAMFSQMDPLAFEHSLEAAAARLIPLFERAMARGVFLNLDMEDHHRKDLTLALFKRVLDDPRLVDMAHSGIVLQAYHRDAEADLKDLLNWLKKRTKRGGHRITIRLVKGAYWDYETVSAHREGWPSPLWLEKPESDACFERLSTLCFSHHAYVRTAIASHNLRTIAHAIVTAEHYGVPQNGYEIQCLYGMAEPIKLACVERGHRVRIYAPVGELLPGMAYLVRRLLENTSNESWLVQGFAEDADPKVLLARPDVPTTHPMLRQIPPPSTDPNAPGPFVNEPLRDFANAAQRAAFAEALDTVAAQIGRTWGPIIDGQTLSTGRVLNSLDPNDGRTIVGMVHEAEPEHAEDAVKRAAAAWPAWRAAPPIERATTIFKLAALMRARRDELAAWMVREVGKPWREADGDVVEAIDFCEYYAREALRLGTPQRLQSEIPGELNHLLYTGRGVAAVIAPWNFPLAILVGMTAAALVTGNTVLVKPAEQSSVIGALMVQLALEAGVPPGVIHFIPGRGEIVGDLLVRHPQVSTIAFTGSREVGLGIWRAAGETAPHQTQLKRVICEMGGKNTVIVDDDADLDEAVLGVVRSTLSFAGQKCSACSRVIVLDTHYEAFIERLVATAQSWTVRDPADPACQMGPVVDAASHARLERVVADATTRLTCRLGAERLDGPGHFVAPAIFTDVPMDDVLFTDEHFGPVLAIAKAPDFETALSMANSGEYALTGGLFSRSPAHIARAREAFLVGNLYINRTITGAVVGRQPFGGFGMSGGGTKAGGPDYLLSFLDPRCVSENTLRRGFAPED